MQETTGRPISGFAAYNVQNLAIPATPAYAKLPLSLLPLDTSGSRGSFYALVLSSTAAIRWHSVDSLAVNRLPSSGIASVYGSWVSTDASSWSSVLPYRGAWLNAIKTFCSPTPSQSQSSSISQSPSVTESPTPSLTASTTETMSQSSSASQSASRSQSPSQSQTPSQSPSETASQSQTHSETPSQSASQTSTGFPNEAVIDNTLAGSAPLLINALRPLSPAVWYGVSFFMPEVDPVCGAGSYLLQTLTLPLALNESVPEGPLLLYLALYAADAVTWTPITTNYIGTPAFPTITNITQTPAYFTVALPSNWIIDTNTQGRYFAVVLYTDVSTVNWVASAGGLPFYEPQPGFGQPKGLYISHGPFVGESWDGPSVPYAGILLTAQKLACSPSNTPSQSQSPSLSPSFSKSPSQTGSKTLSQTESQRITPSVSQTSTSTLSASQTQTRSRTQTRSPTNSGTPTQTPSLTQSISQGLSSSQTQSPTVTLSPSMTQSLSQVASITQTSSKSPSPASTPSLTASITVTQSPSPSYLGAVFIDGTSVLGLPILSGAANATTIDAGVQMAVSFVVVEDDPTCGPGRYTITNMALALSQVATPVVSLTVQMFGIDVSVLQTVSSHVTDSTRATTYIFAGLHWQTQYRLCSDACDTRLDPCNPSLRVRSA